MRILIADDDALSRAVLKHTLVEWGHEVVELADGLRTRAVLRSENPPQLAILDWLMPDVDGIQLCRRFGGPATNRTHTFSFLPRFRT